MAGEIQAQASADLNGVGQTVGPMVSYNWALANSLPSMLPWIAVLGLLALKSNRCAKAWWIWAPLGVWIIGCAVLGAANNIDNPRGEFFLQIIKGAGCGIACVWLLGANLGRWNWVANFASAGFCVFGMGLLCYWPIVDEMEAFYGRSEDALFVIILWIGSALAFSTGFGLAKFTSRRKYRPFRVGLGLFLGLALGWLIVALVLLALSSVTEAVREFHLHPEELTIWVIAASLLSLILLLPFLVLSFTNSFYRERLRCWLGLPSAAPVVATPVEQAQK